MVNVNVICFLASYSVVLIMELMRLLGRSPVRRTIMLLFGTAGFAAHTLYLMNRSNQANLPPLLSSSHDWLLVLAWISILMYLFLTTIDRNLAIGLFVIPLVLFLIAAAYFVSDSSMPVLNVSNLRDAQQAALRRWVMLHASLLVFGIAGVIVGLVLSLMYLVQHRRLKHKQTMQRGLRLPSLAVLSRWNWWAVIISVPLLTLGLATGFGVAFLSDEAVPVSMADPVIMIYGVAWAVMAAFFAWLLTTRRPAGKQVAWMTIWAFGFLLVTLVGLQVLAGSGLDSFHAGGTRDSSGLV